MVIYQFCILSSGEIKVSEAEYVQTISRNNVPYYRKVKTVVKGIKRPRFPNKLYYLGEIDGRYYSMTMEDLKVFTNLELNICNEKILMLEKELDFYRARANNLKKQINHKEDNYDRV